MALTSGQIIETPGAPLVCTSPLMTMPHFERILFGNSEGLAQWTIAPSAVAFQEVVLGGTGVFSLIVYCDQPLGGSITIETQPNGVVALVPWDTLMTTNIIGLGAPGNPQVPNFIGPFELPGWIFRLHVFNLNAGIASFTGILIAKGH